MRGGVFVVVVMHVAVGAGAAEQAPDLMGCEVGNHLRAGLERAGDPFDMVRAHHAVHDLAIDRQRDVDLRPLDHRRPVLVADGMAELHGGVNDRFGVAAGQFRKIGHQHLVEADADGRDAALLGPIFDDVAVEHLRMPLQGHRIFVSAVARRHETALLSRPLVEVDALDLGLTSLLHPFGVMQIA